MRKEVGRESLEKTVTIEVICGDDAPVPVEITGT